MYKVDYVDQVSGYGSLYSILLTVCDILAMGCLGRVEGDMGELVVGQ